MTALLRLPAVPLTSPEQTLLRLDQIVRELPGLNDPRAVKAFVDQTESVRYLTKKLRYNQDIQNAAAEATLWTKRRLGELLPPAQPKGGDRKSISTMDIDIETLGGAAKALGIPQVEASRCVELARLPRQEFEQHISSVKEAEGEVSTSAVLRHIVASRRGSANGSGARPSPPLPAGTFSVLYADPPWQYEFGASSDRAVERHYPTLTIEQIRALPVPTIAAPDAILFLWATSPKLAESLAVMEAWGFSYRSSMVWVKGGLGMGYYARINHEFLLIGRKGAHPAPQEGLRPGSVITQPKGRHSEKPIRFYELIEQMYPEAQKVELFARQQRDGWTAWGNEI